MKKQTKCYIYTRVSTAIQVDGYSLNAQRDKLSKYAEYQDHLRDEQIRQGNFSIAMNNSIGLTFDLSWLFCTHSSDMHRSRRPSSLPEIS